MEKAVAITVLVALASVGLSSAALYTVGDEVGWGIQGDANYYNAWASTKKFHIGDVLRFVYNTTFHSVLVVSRDDYVACNTVNPVRRFRSGHDTIALPIAGNHYFICGTPALCRLGQKFDVLVH